jgi:hypothetical protein
MLFPREKIRKMKTHLFPRKNELLIFLQFLESTQLDTKMAFCLLTVDDWHFATVYGNELQIPDLEFYYSLSEHGKYRMKTEFPWKSEAKFSASFHCSDWYLIPKISDDNKTPFCKYDSSKNAIYFADFRVNHFDAEIKSSYPSLLIPRKKSNIFEDLLGVIIKHHLRWLLHEKFRIGTDPGVMRLPRISDVYFGIHRMGLMCGNYFYGKGMLEINKACNQIQCGNLLGCGLSNVFLVEGEIKCEEHDPLFQNLKKKKYGEEFFINASIFRNLMHISVKNRSIKHPKISFLKKPCFPLNYFFGPTNKSGKVSSRLLAFERRVANEFYPQKRNHYDCTTRMMADSPVIEKSWLTICSYEINIFSDFSHSLTIVDPETKEIGRLVFDEVSFKIIPNPFLANFSLLDKRDLTELLLEQVHEMGVVSIILGLLCDGFSAELRDWSSAYENSSFSQRKELKKIKGMEESKIHHSVLYRELNSIPMSECVLEF